MSAAIHVGDCIEVMAALPEHSVDAVVCDPPYLISFMGKAFDTQDGAHADPRRMQAWHEAWAREALRVLKPGGHLLAFGGTRTYHRLAAGIEDAGFEIRDTIAWMYGSGFPKSLDLSKAIDKAAGADREETGRVLSVTGNRAAPSSAMVESGLGAVGVGPQEHRETLPATPEAAEWEGWGTALKPAYEPVVVARKPLSGTVAQTVLAHGTGALNIDGTRIPVDPDDPVHDAVWTSRPSQFREGGTGFLHGTTEDGDRSSAAPPPGGRWPANVMLDPEAAAMLDEQTGELTSGANPERRGSDKFRDAYGDFKGQEVCVPARGVDSGGASRFFYVAKASSAERHAGLGGDVGLFSATDVPERNDHPTVKPIDVMRWLVRLITPPGGVVLDPFTGSGTTGCAAALEGFEFVGIERDEAYARIARARLAHWSLGQAA